MEYKRKHDERQTKIQEEIARFTGQLVTVGWFQITVAVIGLGGIIVAWRASNAAKESAKAASAQAGVIKSLERPWLVVTPPQKLKPRKVINSIAQSGGVAIDFSVKNIGKGPAFLVEQFAILVRMPYPIPDNEQPDYSGAKPLPKMPIAPNDSHSQRSKPLIIPSEQIRQDIVDGKDCIVFYGRVSYYDTLHEILHKTRFCCYWRTIKGPDGQTIGYQYVPNGHINFIEYD